jgi:hypothetical protein
MRQRVENLCRLAIGHSVLLPDLPAQPTCRLRRETTAGRPLHANAVRASWPTVSRSCAPRRPWTSSTKERSRRCGSGQTLNRPYDTTNDFGRGIWASGDAPSVATRLPSYSAPVGAPSERADSAAGFTQAVLPALRLRRQHGSAGSGHGSHRREGRRPSIPG